MRARATTRAPASGDGFNGQHVEEYASQEAREEHLGLTQNSLNGVEKDPAQGEGPDTATVVQKNSRGFIKSPKEGGGLIKIPGSGSSKGGGPSEGRFIEGKLTL